MGHPLEEPREGLLEVRGEFLFVSMLALAGCGSRHAPNHCDGSDCEPASNPLSECAGDGDCPTGQFCIQGECLPATECSRDNDCPFGEFCVAATGACVECLTEAHCQPPEICRDDGTCGAALGCRDDRDCRDGVCELSSQSCVECLVDDHCPFGNVCEANLCRFHNSGEMPCAAQSDCDPFGRLCRDNVCALCVADAECGSGKICSAGICTRDGSTTEISCTTQVDCDPCADFIDCFEFSDESAGEEWVCVSTTGQCVPIEETDLPCGHECRIQRLHLLERRSVPLGQRRLL